MSYCGWHRQALCHSQLSHEHAHLFLLKSNDCCFSHLSTFAWGFTPASWLNFPSSFSTIVPCNIFELCLTLTKPAVNLLSSSQTAQHKLKTSKYASMVSPTFFMFLMKKGYLAFFWMKDLLLDLECGYLKCNTLIVTTASSSRRWT